MPQNHGPVGPLALVFYRIMGAVILFWLVGFFFREKIEKKDIKKLMLLGALGVAINQGFFIYGLSLTEPINSAIIMISSPITVLLISVIFFQGKMGLGKISGIILGSTGALILLMFNRNFNLGSSTALGDTYTLINSVSWACFMVISKPIIEKYNVVTVMKWIFLFGFLYFLPFGLKDVCKTDYQSFSQSHWVALSFVIIGTTFFAYLLNTYALKKLNSTTVASYIFIQPFLAGFIAISLGKDELYLKKIFAGALIIIGVWLISRKEKIIN